VVLAPFFSFSRWSGAGGREDVIVRSIELRFTPFYDLVATCGHDGNIWFWVFGELHYSWLRASLIYSLILLFRKSWFGAS